MNRDNPDTSVGWFYYDGFSRNSRVRYDTPNFGGLTGAVSFASGDRQELAARFNREVGPGRLIVLAGLANSADGSNDRTMISGGYQFNNRFSFAGSRSTRTQADDAPDLESIFLSANYQFGKTIVSFDFGQSGVDGEDEIQKVGFIYKSVKQIDLYGGYVNFNNADDTSLASGFAGARYKF